MRVFNVRYGIKSETEAPSPRYCSSQVDGPLMGRSVLSHWDRILDLYYKKMDWNREKKTAVRHLEKPGSGFCCFRSLAMTTGCSNALAAAPLKRKGDCS